MKIKYLVIATLALFSTINDAKTSLNSQATPAGSALYYVTQPQASDDEANTYIDAFELLPNYKPGLLIAMMVNEAGAKIQAGLMANAVVGYNYKIVCNFNIGNDAVVTAQDSFKAFQGNTPSICTGGYAIDYEPTDTGNNFHIDYISQLIPLLRSVNASAPIYLYFNPNEMALYAQLNPNSINSFAAFLAQNNVTMLWPIYSLPNANNLSQLFTTYPALQKLPYQLLFNILNSNTVQTQILNTLSGNGMTNYNKAFWQVISSINCPVDDTKTCVTNLENSLSVFPAAKE